MGTLVHYYTTITLSMGASYYYKCLRWDNEFFFNQMVIMH